MPRLPVILTLQHFCRAFRRAFTARWTVVVPCDGPMHLNIAKYPKSQCFEGNWLQLNSEHQAQFLHVLQFAVARNAADVIHLGGKLKAMH